MQVDRGSERRVAQADEEAADDDGEALKIMGKEKASSDEDGNKDEDWRS